MRNLKGLVLMFALLVIALSVQGAHAQSTQTPTNSAAGSKSSGTAAKNDRGLVAACADAAEELAATREANAALEKENAALGARLSDEKKLNALLTELNETRRTESEALRRTIEAKNETIAAKDAAIKAQDELIAKLRTKRSSPWKRIGDILIGVGAAVLLK
ncbi:MAG TPA: hypothetical protein PKC89_03315 [Pyrinomonadaceae bacterium]|nr:hypothetical protein [Pyrinomonadaceae bacterium]